MRKTINRTPLVEAAYGLLILSLVACAGPEPDFSGFGPGEAGRETRWDGLLTVQGEALPLTLISRSSPRFSDRRRLLILSSFGAVLGDCLWLDGAPAVCRRSPGDRAAKLALEALGHSPGWPSAERIEYQNSGRPFWSLAVENVKQKTHKKHNKCPN